MGNRTRKIAEILGRANHSTGKMSADTVDVSFENISDTGTEGTKVATGTTGQRGSTTGQLRFNTDTGLAEYYTGSAFKSIDAPPTVSSVGNNNITDAQISANYDLSISGSGFGSGATVKFIGNDGTEYNSSTVTVNSDTSITARVPTSVTNANEPFDVKVTNVSGLSATLADAFNVDGKPAWQTASGTIATIYDSATGTHATVSATDPEGDAITYSETGDTVLSTQNFSLDSSTGAISGDPVNVVSSTTHTFTLRATSGTNTADRSFNIIVNPALDGSSSGRANTSAINIYNLGITSNGYYWLDLDGTPRQFYCDMTNGGFILFSHWSANTSGGGTASVGSTSYANAKGYTGATTTAVAQPSSADDVYNSFNNGGSLSSSNTSGSFAWDGTTRGTNTGGTWHRNASNTSGNARYYRPNIYGYNWTNGKARMRISAPGGVTPYADSNDYNSLDSFTTTNDINSHYVDGVSIHTGYSNNRTHIYSSAFYPSGGSPTTPQGFINSYDNVEQHSGTSTSASFETGEITFSQSSASIPPEIAILSDQETTNEDCYLREWYIFLK